MRLRSILLCIVVLAILSAIEMKITKIQKDSEFSGYWKYESCGMGKVKMTDYSGAETVVQIPDKKKKKKVVMLESELFEGNCYVEKIIIPPTVHTVGAYCFRECEALETVEGYENIEEDEYSTFYGCKSLKRITLGNQLEEISLESFKNCTSLEEIEIPASVTQIDDGAFVGCTSIKSVVVPENVLWIGNSFSECTSLKSAEIHARNVGAAFCNCSSLKNVIIGEECEELEYETFKNCPKLKRIEIPSSVRKIGMRCFSGCTALKKVEFHRGLTIIDGWVFEECTSLKKIILPNTVTNIGDAFWYCDIEDIEIPKSVTQIEGIGDMYGEGEGERTATIHCYENSYAEDFAKEYGFDYVLISEIPCEELTVEQSEINIDVGSKSRIRYSVLPENTTDAVIWESSDEDIVEINDVGEITGIGKGVAAIVVTTTNGKKEIVDVYVE